LGDYTLALAHSLEILELARRLGDRHGETYAFNLICKTQITIGSYHEALDNALRNLELLEAIDASYEDAFLCYTNLGLTHRYLESFDRAHYFFQKSLDEAKEAFQMGFYGYKKQEGKLNPAVLEEINLNSIAVDAACSGNPGKMEYQGVVTKNKQVLFKKGPFANGTNNIGEFLALVHALAFLKQKELNTPIYTDSRTAMSWVRQKKCKTKLKQNSNNQKLFELVARAEIWLKQNTYSNPILKWETKQWGEIPADFGRK
jgi:ribonuclease HI